MKTKRIFPIARGIMYVFFAFHFSLFTFHSFSQGIAINTTGAEADDTAILDISSTNQGILIPRVSLTDVAVYAPITGAPVVSLLVYSNTAPTGGGGTGFYYWNGSQWLQAIGPTGATGAAGATGATGATGVAGSLNAWGLTGNTGTNAGTNFIGTIDNASLGFRTDNAKRMIIDSLGNLGIGTTEPTSRLYVKTTETTTVPFQIEANASSYSWLGWLSEFNYRKKITIDELKVDADLTDFPVLVKLTSSNFDFSKALSSGNDIRFTSSDGTTLLKYGRERHDNVNSLAEYWVKVPSVSGTVNTDFYIYYGNFSASDGADQTNVWDSNFKGVWHMNDFTSGTIADATINSSTGTKKGTGEPAEADGKVGKAQNFDNSDDYISSNYTIDPSTISNFTIEAFIKWSGTLSNFISPIIINVKDVDNYLGIGVTGSGKFTWHIRKTGNTLRRQRVTGNVIPSGTWKYVVITKTGDNDVTAYIDAVENTSREDQSDDSFGGTVQVKIGRQDGGYPSTFDGIIDEVRVSNTARSAAWIKASYNTENNSFVTYGSEDTPSLSFQQKTVFYVQNSSGNVGIGTTNPNDLLDVQGGNIRNSALAGTGSRAVVADANGVLSANAGSGTTCLTWLPLPIPPFDGEYPYNKTLNSNTTLYVGQIFFPFGITANKFTIRTGSTITTPGTVTVSLYSEDGQTRIFSVTTASISAANSLIETALNNVVISPGIYYIAVNSNSTANLQLMFYKEGSNIPFGATASILNGVTSKPLTHGTLTISASTAPATISPTGLSATIQNTLVIRFDK
ncbi:MAG: DUF2341 domain-containing protein [Bacteroidetes bacterium]|nr:DUF2341 domain-containing protein [Bacteroidota bacterium]